MTLSLAAAAVLSAAGADPIVLVRVERSKEATALIRECLLLGLRFDQVESGSSSRRYAPRVVAGLVSMPCQLTRP